jgi:hypothetical protein
MEWQPISTAPEEGEFLVYIPNNRRTKIQVARWHPNVKIVGGVFSFDLPPITHWAPLPPPPTEKD